MESLIADYGTGAQHIDETWLSVNGGTVYNTVGLTISFPVDTTNLTLGYPYTGGSGGNAIFSDTIKKAPATGALAANIYKENGCFKLIGSRSGIWGGSLLYDNEKMLYDSHFFGVDWADAEESGCNCRLYLVSFLYLDCSTPQHEQVLFSAFSDLFHSVQTDA